MHRYVVAIIIGVVSCTAPAAAYYNPGTPSGFVNDFAGIIDDGQEQAIEQQLRAFEQETTNEISVVTIQSLEGDSIEHFATELFSEWGIGKAAEDNGILLLIAVKDRSMRIEVGYGLEGALTDAQSFWIIQNTLTPAFRAERFSEGIAEAVTTMIRATQGEYVPEASSDDQSAGMSYEFIAWIVIFGFLWLGSILGRSKSWWAGGVIGGIAGVIVGLIKGFMLTGVIAIAVLIPFGLLFDFIVSKNYQSARARGTRPPWWIGGGGFGSGGGSFGGGGFGGFGGGMSGGGGSSGGW